MPRRTRAEIMAPGETLPSNADFVVVGGGVVGATIALEIRRRFPGERIVVLEKEAQLGKHASGRNSGVVHAGFYYSADSLKARLTRDGNARLVAWCERHGVPVRRCGKLVVARSESEHGALDELVRRARANGVALESIDEDEARRIEPLARTVGRALWSPATAVVSPRAVVAALAAQLERASVVVATSAAWRSAEGSRIRTDRGVIDAGYLVNAAGLYADRIAQAYGFGDGYRILPFRGAYLLGRARAPALRMHVYPVPDLAMPFLGTHFSVTLDGGVKIGPTAMPALWREGYAFDRESLSRFSWRELGEVAWSGAHMLVRDASFRRHAGRELSKLWRSRVVEQAGSLVRGVRAEDFDRWGAAGIRAQLYDVRQQRLVMDFCFQGDDRSLHVLNAVSPAFTCCFAFAEHLVDAMKLS